MSGNFASNSEESSGSRQRPLILGHRGSHSSDPENSIEAVKAALAAGADGVEVDLRLTADNEVLLSHDPLVGRTPLCELTRARRLSDPVLGRLDTLDDLLVHGGDQLYNLELKPDPGGRAEHFVDTVLEKLGPRSNSPEILFSSFDWSMMEIMKLRSPDSNVALLVNYATPLRAAIGRACEFGLSGVNIHRRRATAHSLDTISKYGLSVAVWTVDSQSEAINLSYHPVTVIITNKITEIRRAVDSAMSRGTGNQ